MLDQLDAPLRVSNTPTLGDAALLLTLPDRRTRWWQRSWDRVVWACRYLRRVW